MRMHPTLTVIAVLLALSGASCRGSAHFRNYPCGEYTSHERFVVSEMLLPANPLEYAYDVDGDGVAENGFGYFVQATRTLDGYSMQDYVSLGVAKRDGALLIDIMSNPETGCSAVSLNIAVPPSSPISGSPNDEYETTPGQKWVTIPLQQVDNYWQTPETKSVDAIMPDFIDVFMNASPLTSKYVFLPFRIYNPQIRLERIADGQIEIKLNGTVNAAEEERLLIPYITSVLTSYINENANSIRTETVIGLLESGPLSDSKCDKKIENCCREWRSMPGHQATCKILPAEVRASPFLRSALKPDVQAFQDGLWRPTPKGADKNALSFGVLLRAKPARHRSPCTSGAFCRDSRYPPVGAPALAAQSLRRIWGREFNDVWLGTEGNQIIHFDGLHWTLDGAWTTDTMASTTPIESIQGNRLDDVYVSTGYGKPPYKWDGIGWNLIEPQPPGMYIYDTASDSAGRLYAASSLSPSMPGYVYGLTGASWGVDQMTVGGFVRVIPVEDSIFASGRLSKVSRKDASGWHEDDLADIFHSSSSFLSGLWGNSTDNVWVGGSGGACARWNGMQWEGMSGCSAGQGDIRGFWGYKQEQIWIASKEGVVRWRRAPITSAPWSEWRAGSGVGIYGVWGSRPDDVWAIGDSGGLWKYQP